MGFLVFESFCCAMCCLRPRLLCCCLNCLLMHFSTFLCVFESLSCTVGLWGPLQIFPCGNKQSILSDIKWNDNVWATTSLQFWLYDLIETSGCKTSHRPLLTRKKGKRSLCKLCFKDTPYFISVLSRMSCDNSLIEGWGINLTWGAPFGWNEFAFTLTGGRYCCYCVTQTFVWTVFIHNALCVF